jgi:hypothetical protein
VAVLESFTSFFALRCERSMVAQPDLSRRAEANDRIP